MYRQLSNSGGGIAVVGVLMAGSAMVYYGVRYTEHTTDMIESELDGVTFSGFLKDRFFPGRKYAKGKMDASVITSAQLEIDEAAVLAVSGITPGASGGAIGPDEQPGDTEDLDVDDGIAESIPGPAADMIEIVTAPEPIYTTGVWGDSNGQSIGNGRNGQAFTFVVPADFLELDDIRMQFNVYNNQTPKSDLHQWAFVRVNETVIQTFTPTDNMVLLTKNHFAQLGIEFAPGDRIDLRMAAEFWGLQVSMKDVSFTFKYTRSLQ